MCLSRIAACAALSAGFLCATVESAVVLVSTGDPAHVNNQIGSLLNDTSSINGKFHFPTSGDPSYDFGPTEAPNLSAASAVLGNWLNQPTPDLTAPGWQNIASPTINWVPGTEIALVYEFHAQSITNLVVSIGVDNGVYLWFDGTFVGGAMRPGGVALGEHVFNLGNQAAGAHFVQLILEDHGSQDGFALEITADEIILPEPAALGALAAFGPMLPRRRRTDR